MVQNEAAPYRAATSLERALILSDVRVQYPDLPWASAVSRMRARAATGVADEAAPSEEAQAEALLNECLQRYERRLFPEGKTPEAPAPSLAVGTAPNRRIDAFAQAVLEKSSEAYDAAMTAGRIAPDDETVAVIKWPTAQAEVEGTARLVRQFMAADESLLPQDIYLVAFDEATAEALQNALYHHRLESTVALDDDPLAGDPRTPTAAMEAWARLALAADEDDLLSWRVWCALGKRSLSTKPWLAFMTWADGENLSASEAFERLLAAQDEPFEGAATLAEQIARGKRFASTAGQLKGLSLVKACNPEDDRSFLRLVGRVEGDETPQELLARVSANARWQRFDDAPHAVRIGSLRHCLALAPRVLIVVGTVEGVCPDVRIFDDRVPEERRRTLEARDRKLFAAAVARAQEQLVVSFFQALPEAEAHMRGSVVVRIMSQSGEPLARVRPSRFIADAQNAAPGTQSAEQYEMRG